MEQQGATATAAALQLLQALTGGSSAAGVDAGAAGALLQALAAGARGQTGSGAPPALAGFPSSGSGGTAPGAPASAALPYRSAPQETRHRALRQLSVAVNALGRAPLAAGDPSAPGEAPTADGLTLLLDLVSDPLVAAQLLYTGLDARLYEFAAELRRRRSGTRAGDGGGDDGLELEEDAEGRRQRLLSATGRVAKIHFPPEQKAVLERAFRRRSVLNKSEGAVLADELSRCTDARGGRLPLVAPAQVATWFANKRKALNRAARIREEAAAEAVAQQHAQLLARGIDVSKLPALPASSGRGATDAAAAARARGGALLAAAAARTASEREKEREREQKAARAATMRAATAANLQATQLVAAGDGGAGAAEDHQLMTQALSREPPSTQAQPSHELPPAAAEGSRRPQRSTAGRRLAEAGGAAAVEAGISLSLNDYDGGVAAARWAAHLAQAAAAAARDPYRGRNGAEGAEDADGFDDGVDAGGVGGAAGDEDADEAGRVRRRVKPYQRVERRLRACDSEALEAFFCATAAPNVAQRNGIAAAMGLTLDQVTTWFKRRQAQPAAPAAVGRGRAASGAASVAMDGGAAAMQRALSLASAGGGGLERLTSRLDSSAAVDVAARMLSGRLGSTTREHREH